GRDRGRTSATIPQFEYRQENARRAAAGTPGRRQQDAPSGASGRGWTGLADRVRQYWESVSGARERPPKGDCNQGGDGGYARAPVQATAYRKPDTFIAWRGPGGCRRISGDAIADCARSGQYHSSVSDRNQRSGAWLYSDSFVINRHRFWPCPGFQMLEAQS